MKDIVDVLKQKSGFDCFGKASNEDIKVAEKDLNLKFAEEFKKYLMEFGVAEIDGHEFTGIFNSKRLNVVDVTKKIKNKYNNLNDDMYVIEELNIDNIVILQDSKGTIFECTINSKPKKIFNSFAEYVELL